MITGSSAMAAEVEEKLREAACFGDLEGLVTLLAQGADVNAQHKVNGWTALHWASKRNNLQCVEALLARGADKMVYTSKGELAAHLTTSKQVLQVLGYSGQHTKENKKKRQQVVEAVAAPTPPPPFVPNYLRHPPMNYKVDISQVQQHQPKKVATTPKQEAGTPVRTPQRESSGRSSSAGRGDGSLRVAASAQQQVTKARSANNLEENNHVLAPPSQPQFRILKVRLVGRPEYDRDFIEVDVPEACLTFRRLIDVVCEEFSLDPKVILKVRKLPNTKLRRDAEIQRLQDYQEIEVETIDLAA